MNSVVYISWRSNSAVLLSLGDLWTWWTQALVEGGPGPAEGSIKIIVRWSVIGEIKNNTISPALSQGSRLSRVLYLVQYLYLYLVRYGLAELCNSIVLPIRTQYINPYSI